jgi:hypothetical protein
VVSNLLLHILYLLSLPPNAPTAPPPSSLHMVQNVYSHLVAATAAPAFTLVSPPAVNAPLTPTEDWIRQVFIDVVENMNTNKNSYERYFSHNYIQHTNGKIWLYPAFVTHMQTQKASMQRINVHFDQIVVDGNHIATIHVVTATKPNGIKVRAKVMAFFTVENMKIVACDEVSLPML